MVIVSIAIALIMFVLAWYYAKHAWLVQQWICFGVMAFCLLPLANARYSPDLINTTIVVVLILAGALLSHVYDVAKKKSRVKH